MKNERETIDNNVLMSWPESGLPDDTAYYSNRYVT
jgi:hypothetical protein